MDRVDAIILTGGIAHSKQLTDRVCAMIDRYAPVVIMPGENEMMSLALGALRVLQGTEEAKIYGQDIIE
jgi:butyrate kinase